MWAVDAVSDVASLAVNAPALAAAANVLSAASHVDRRTAVHISFRTVEKKGYSGVAVFSKVCGGKWDLVEGPRYGIPP